MKRQLEEAEMVEEGIRHSQSPALRGRGFEVLSTWLRCFLVEMGAFDDASDLPRPKSGEPEVV